MTRPELLPLREYLQRHDLEAAWPLLGSWLPGAGRNASTVNNQRSALRSYFAAAAAERTDLLQPDPAFIQEYVTLLQSRSPGYVRNTLSHLRGLYKALRALGLVRRTFDPFLGLPGPSLAARPGERRRWFLPAELDRLLAEADTENRLLLLLGAHAGLRTGEVVALTWRDLQLSGDTVSVHGRQVPKSVALEQALHGWARKNGGLLAEGLVFALADLYAVRRRLYTLCMRANVPYRPWQALRATYALHLWEATHDPRIMGEQLGLGSMKAIEAYQRMEAATHRPLGDDASERG